MIEMAAKPFIKGLTTNPTLMRKAGITDYRSFALDVLKDIPNKPISFEVFSDDFTEMERQAIQISSWGKNVYVKIPITNTQHQSACELVRKLSKLGIKLNVTALMTLEQVREVAASLEPTVPSYISVFAGRIADTGQSPEEIVKPSLDQLSDLPQTELIWASPRELLNIVQAATLGCHVITLGSDLLSKIGLLGKPLEEYSLETVKMFYEDAIKSGFTL
jgi:transaldolase